MYQMGHRRGEDFGEGSQGSMWQWGIIRETEEAEVETCFIKQCHNGEAL